jgi:thiamine biosynthesis lipoprotein
VNGPSLLGTETFAALGTTATVAVARPELLPQARALLESRLDRLDRLCSRFRDDSELSQANADAGRTGNASPELRAAVEVALAAANETGGLVDPTIGRALRDAGYDRTFALVRSRGSWTVLAGQPAQARRHGVIVDNEHHTLTIPEGVEVDLGATAKAREADDAACELAATLETGVLVSLGGDIAVAGATPGSGWCVRIADDHADRRESEGPLVLLKMGGLATSGTTVRRWPTDAGEAHHLIDPRTCRPADTPWRTVSVAASSCLEANIAATAAVILGDAALEWLRTRSLHARLVTRAGAIRYVGEWPRIAEAA